MTATIETVPLRLSNDLAFAAAQLFVSEIAVFKPLTAEIYLAGCNPDAEHLYTISETEFGLVAAAKVMYQQQIYGSSNTKTFVQAIAVHRERKKQGNCLALLRHVAGQSLIHGDAYVSLLPTSKDSKAFGRIGFTNILCGSDLDAVPETILAHRSSHTIISV